MSIPAPTSPPLHPTRRQLDDLDALVERMLELPVKPGEEEAKNSATEEALLPDPASDSPFAGFSSHDIASYQADDNETSAADAQGAFQFTSSDPARENDVSSTRVSHGQPSLNIAEPTSVPAGSSSAIAISGLSRGAVDDGPPPSIWLWPVVGINQIYDVLMGGLGSPGQMMRRTGRAWLGWIGLLMVAAALAWGLLDWLQWAG